MAQFYKEFFQPKAIYKPVMTKEAIEADPNTWLGFYPHQTFLRVLSTLFEKFEVGDRSVWMYVWCVWYGQELCRTGDPEALHGY
ncbi:MAG: hypothetical protein MJ249_02150 [Kiritimatiellae bacterium]|nr:hypothetical protein [Kiritimatiellia bacterium]